MSTDASRRADSAPPARRARSGANGDASTRQSVIDATLASICDLGYYRASSNQIAKRAGVSWGVIQHYFGSRQALLLAVLENAVQQALAALENVALEGLDPRDKIGRIFDLMFDFFGRREYLAVMQILWNLGRDPETESSTLAAQDGFAKRLNERWREIFFDELGVDVDEDRIKLAYLVMWGISLEEAASALMPATDGREGRIEIGRRKELTIETVEWILLSRPSVTDR